MTRKTPKPKITALRDKADKLRARAIRIRDCDYVDGAWQGRCITCERMCVVVDAAGKWQKSNGWGHFIGRGCMYLRYDEENVNLQCSHCNAWRDKSSMLDAYETALEDKYGSGTVARLKAQAKEFANWRLTIEFLQEIIHDSEEQLRWNLETANVK